MSEEWNIYTKCLISENLHKKICLKFNVFMHNAHVYIKINM